MKKKFEPSKSHLILFSLVAILLVGIAYLSTLNAPFIMDDKPAILDNPKVGDPGLIFARPLEFTRPLMIFISYTMGGLDPFYYHIFNVLFHIGTVIFVFLVIRELFNERYAWITAILYAVHPILTESVTWISAVTYTQYSFLLLMSLYGYIRYSKGKSIRWYWGSLVASALSILFAEKGIALPVILILLELCFFSLKKHWKRLIPYFIITIIIAGALVLNIGARQTTLQKSYYSPPTFYNPLVHIPYSITHYIQLILFPKDLTVYHVEHYISPLNLGLRWVFFVLLLIADFIAYKKSKPVFFWFSFFFIAIAPTLIPLSIVWMVAERYVYLGTVGIVAVVAYPLSVLSKNKKYSTYIYVLIGFLTLSLLIRTLVRNNDWQNEDSLWVATVKTSPDSPNAHNNMGDVYSRWNDYPYAAEEFTIATKLKPDYGDAYHNLGLTYLQMGQFADAEKSFHAALKYNPYLWQSHERLAVVYYQRKNYKAAVEEINKAIEIVPNNVNLQNELKLIGDSAHKPL